MKKLVKVVFVLMMAVSLMACQSEKKEEVEVILEGKQGDTLSTMFFDYQVNDSYLIEQLNMKEPENKAQQFLVVNITVKNIEMADTDFKVRYNNKDADPLTTYKVTGMVEDELASKYTLNAKEEKTGNLVFVVDKEVTDFTLETTEHYNTNKDETVKEGNTFKLSFTATQKEVKEEN